MIQSELGRGGFGVVYLAHDLKLHSRPVVIKVLLEANAAHDEWFHRKFAEEIEALARIDHPGVVGVLDAGETPEGLPFLVLQFVNGVTLRSVLRDGTMGFRDVASIIKEIGRALNAAHECGVWHRDLKPENIMLQDLGQGDRLVKIIDFGIASVREARQEARSPMGESTVGESTVGESTVGESTVGESTRVSGSYPYMAPEQLMGKPAAASDIYAMGVIACEMLTGRRPFRADSTVQLFLLQQQGVDFRMGELRPGLPPAAEEIIRRALAFNAKDRPASARDLGDQLSIALGGSDTQSPVRYSAAIGKALDSFLPRVLHRILFPDGFPPVGWKNYLRLAAIGVLFFLVFMIGSRQFFPGHLAIGHGVFEGRGRCDLCHGDVILKGEFSRVADAACERCHVASIHPATIIDSSKANFTPRCAECHEEHRGGGRLTDVADRQCTKCHGDLTANAINVTIKGVAISAFREGKHPEFSTAGLKDARPLKLNHQKHMQAESKKFPTMGRLPMNCLDCHKADLESTTGDLIPMTFEANCKSCHKREMQFDLYNVLGTEAVAAPHTRDQSTLREFVEKTYRDALAAKPELVKHPLGQQEVSPDRWIVKAAEDSYEFLWREKCTYCHEMESQYEVKKIDPRPPPQLPNAQIPPLGIKGRYPDGQNWFERSSFSHRLHRNVGCESCHTAAAASTKTKDILIPEMKSCLPCHGESRAGLDRCAECHLYHNRTLEKERERKPTRNILGQLTGKPAVIGQ